MFINDFTHSLLGVNKLVTAYNCSCNNVSDIKRTRNFNKLIIGTKEFRFSLHLTLLYLFATIHIMIAVLQSNDSLSRL